MMLAKSYPEFFSRCVLYLKLTVSVENIKGDRFGVGVVDFATAVIAIKIQIQESNPEPGSSNWYINQSTNR